MTVEDKFKAFDAANPDVYAMFRRFMHELLSAGHTRLSSKMIIERIRWETAITTHGSAFKIDNRFTAWYARKAIADFPHILTGRFELREIRTP
jgi:hypothetical protein